MKKWVCLVSSLCLFVSLAQAYVVSAAELLDKLYLSVSKTKYLPKDTFYQLLRQSPYSIKAFEKLPKIDRIRIYLQVSELPETKKVYYFGQFSQLDDGDRLLIQSLQEKKNLDEVLTEVRTVVPRRRVTNLEKSLMNSKNAQKVYLQGRSVIKRDVFQCTPQNIALMKQGKAPIGIDGKKIHLHHLKQQKNGGLIELTATEHTRHSAILHRYVRKESEISDRNGDFMRFRKLYWQKRSFDCLKKF